MLIRCWGARGSIPVSGSEYVKYGGDTPCIEIRTKNDEIIIIDAGSGIRKLGNRLLKEGRFDFTMIFTHSHWDHIIGFPFFKPIYLKKTNVQIFGCPASQGSLEKLLGDIMSPPHFPVSFNEIKANLTFENNDSCRTSYQIDSVRITPIALSHPNRGLGFKFEEDGKTFVFLTDNELAFKHPGGLDYDDYMNFSKGADLLIHDSEYTESEYKIMKTWGHSLYTDALRLAIEAEVKTFGLYHHNQDHTDEIMDSMVADCNSTAASQGSALSCLAVSQDMEFKL
ncbi:MAG: MBL fold metallo-hydrolase [Nitrospirae bacterium]|nr:MAG: MBL fold metallo-hydrolase [Nitrospirota bacterium]